MIKRKKKRPRNIPSKDNQQDQDLGSILIMSGWKKISGHVNHISIENCIKLDLGVMIKTYQIFGVPIGNAKMEREVQFHPAAPVIKYHQNTSNSLVE